MRVERKSLFFSFLILWQAKNAASRPLFFFISKFLPECAGERQQADAFRSDFNSLRLANRENR